MTLLDFTLEDERVLRSIIEAAKNTPANPPTRASADHSWHTNPDYLTPEVYIAFPKDHDSGIPGATDAGTGTAPDIPGSALCDIFKISSSNTLVDTGFDKTVYNIDTNAIDAKWLVVKRTKFGKWVAESSISSDVVLVPFEITTVDEDCQFVHATIYDPHGCYDDLPTSITVYDLLGCYFNEPRDELLGVRGWATKRDVRISTFTEAETGTGSLLGTSSSSAIACTSEYIVVHLCCTDLI